MILIFVQLFTMTYRALSLQKRTKRLLSCSHRRRQREKSQSGRGLWNEGPAAPLWLRFPQHLWAQENWLSKSLIMFFFLLGTQGDYISQHPLSSVWSCDSILANGKWVEARMVYETRVYSNYPFSSPPSGWEWKGFWGHREQQSLGRGWAGRRLDSWVTAAAAKLLQ